MENYLKLKKLHEEIDTLVELNVTSEDPTFITWEKKLERVMRKQYGEGPELDDLTRTGFSPMFFDATHQDKVRVCFNGLSEIKAKLRAYLDEMEEEIQSVGESTKQSLGFSDNFLKVFIVHGHDNALKQEIARMIEKQGITAIILSEQANSGDTVIEKIEKNSDVSAAICLFTEDDLGKSKSEEILNSRARQNVIFEAGYFIGKLGRKRVVLLAKGKIEMPSDLAGVVYTSEKNWEFEVLKELKTMGYNIDMNKFY